MPISIADSICNFVMIQMPSRTTTNLQGPMGWRGLRDCLFRSTPLRGNILYIVTGNELGHIMSIYPNRTHLRIYVRHKIGNEMADRLGQDLDSQPTAEVQMCDAPARYHWYRDRDLNSKQLCLLWYKLSLTETGCWLFAPQFTFG